MGRRHKHGPTVRVIEALKARSSPHPIGQGDGAVGPYAVCYVNRRLFWGATGAASDYLRQRLSPRVGAPSANSGAMLASPHSGCLGCLPSAMWVQTSSTLTSYLLSRRS